MLCSFINLFSYYCDCVCFHERLITGRLCTSLYLFINITISINFVLLTLSFLNNLYVRNKLSVIHLFMIPRYESNPQIFSCNTNTFYMLILHIFVVVSIT